MTLVLSRVCRREDGSVILCVQDPKRIARGHRALMCHDAAAKAGAWTAEPLRLAAHFTFAELIPSQFRRICCCFSQCLYIFPRLGKRVFVFS